jgi:hypothetical protein
MDTNQLIVVKPIMREWEIIFYLKNLNSTILFCKIPLFFLFCTVLAAGRAGHVWEISQ